MKKLLITICAVVGLILTNTSLSTADDAIPPGWRGDDRTVTAAWNSWTGFSGPMLPDSWNHPSELGTPNAYAEGALLKSSYAGRSSVLKMSADQQLEFNMPNFESGEYKEVWIQVTYFPVGTTQQLPLFDVDGTPTESVFKGSENWQDGWLTSAYSLQIRPNPSKETIGLNFSSYLAYVDQVVIDTKCFVDTPEPTTIAMLGLGALSVIRRKRRA